MRKGCLNDLVARGVWPDGAIQTESRAFEPEPDFSCLAALGWCKSLTLFRVTVVYVEAGIVGKVIRLSAPRQHFRSRISCSYRMVYMRS